MKMVIFRENERFGVPHPYIGMHKMVDKGAPVFPYGQKFHFRKNFIFNKLRLFTKVTIFEGNLCFHKNSRNIGCHELGRILIDR